MSGGEMIQKTKICVLHGASSNAGDFLIYERGKKLLENFFDDNFDFTYKLRSERIDGDFDGLIILGGPLISRKMHIQSKNIIDYLKKIEKDIPIFCIGLGISGGKFDSDKNYFFDNESISFWKYAYGTSKLFSARDKITYNVLKNYDIKAELTGCPALFNLETLEKNNILTKNKRINKIAVTIPHLSLSFHRFFSIKSFLLTLYFLFTLKRKFNKKELGLFFQHGYNNLPNKIMQKLANTIGIKTYDISGKSLDSSKELCEYEVHRGTRLHSHIYFLSSNKPSFLLNVDMRTEAFLKTIETQSDKYTISGIENLVDMLKERIARDNFYDFNNVFGNIRSFYAVMKNFLNKIVLFYRESENYALDKNQR
jgi:polysaccharide pyruvyl transferase WcaK-like protein